MSRLSRSTKKDGNHHQVTEGFQWAGWRVIDSSAFFQLGQPGFPDLMVMRYNFIMVVEIKNGKDASFTRNEIKWRAQWPHVPYVVAYSREDAMRKGTAWARWADEVSRLYEREWQGLRLPAPTW